MESDAELSKMLAVIEAYVWFSQQCEACFGKTVLQWVNGNQLDGKLRLARR